MKSVRCAEYKWLQEAYADAARECTAANLRPPTSVYSSGLIRQATLSRDEAKKSVMTHRKMCLLCANIPSEGR
jgi:hypothetical protein